MAKTPDREDVLYMFAIEDVRDRATFNKYVELYPQYRRDLLHLWRRLAIEDDKDKAAMAKAGEA